MPIVRKFIRHSSPKGLKAYFEHQGIDILDIDWRQEGSTVIKQILRSADCLSKEQKVRLKIDAERISQMTDELGQQSLLSMVDEREQLEKIDNPYDCACWVYLHHPGVFRRAQDMHYADGYRGKRRNWTPFDGPKAKMRLLPESMDAFKSKVAVQLGLGQNLWVDRFHRKRTGDDGVAHELIQFMIYQEDLPRNDLAFEGSQLVAQIRRPVREMALTYEAATGRIEIVAKTLAHRKILAETFAKYVLGASQQLVMVPAKRFDLSVLTSPCVFDTDIEDRIERVDVVQLRVHAPQMAKMLTLESDNVTQKCIAASNTRLFGSNATFGLCTINKAKITTIFHPEGRGRRGQRISFTIAEPSTCNLTDHTERERLIRDKYLARWGLVKEDVA